MLNYGSSYGPEVIGGVKMDFVTVFLVAVALGTDALSMAMGLGLSDDHLAGYGLSHTTPARISRTDKKYFFQ